MNIMQAFFTGKSSQKKFFQVNCIGAAKKTFKKTGLNTGKGTGKNICKTKQYITFVLYNLFVMDSNLVVFIKRSMEKDEKELLDNPKKGFKQPKNALYLDSFEQLNKMLSPKRIDLLWYLIEEKKKGHEKSVSELAKSLNRKQEAISRDLHYLKSLKLVELKKSSQTVFAFTELTGIDVRVGEEA